MNDYYSVFKRIPLIYHTMPPQQKRSRIFKLISYLAQQPAKMIPQLAEWLETDKTPQLKSYLNERIRNLQW